MMVTVVAIQELEAGDVLRRFGAETAPDEPRRGSNNNRCVVIGLVAVGVWKLSLHVEFFSLVFLFFFLFSLVHLCVMMICATFLVMFGILYKVIIAHACW